MTAIATSRVTEDLPRIRTWTCERFRADGVTAMVTDDMRSVLLFDSTGSVRVGSGGISVAGDIAWEDGILVFEGGVRTPAPWGWVAGSFEDRLTEALTGRLVCEFTAERLTMRRGGVVIDFMPDG